MNPASTRLSSTTLARARGRQVDVGRKPRRRLEQSGQHRGLGQVHVARRLVEIILRRGIDAEGAAAHIGAVEIQFQNLVLGQARFQPHRQEGFLDLALDRALVVQEQIFGELLRQRRAALDHAAGLGVGDEGARGAGDVDAEMVVEAAVLGGEHRLDQIVGKLVERHRIVMPYAAGADLVAVAVEEGDGELRLLEPVVVRGLAERRHGERQHQNGAGGAERGAFRDDFVEGARPAGDVEAVHEGGKPLIALAQVGIAAEQPGIDAGVEAQHQLLDFRLPIGRKKVAQGVSLMLGRIDRRRGLILADRGGGGQSAGPVNRRQGEDKLR